AASLLHVEIRFRHGQCGVICRRLKSRLPRLHDLPGCERTENGIAQGEHGVRRTAQQEAALTRIDNVALYILKPAIVAEIINAKLNGWQPQNLRSLILRRRQSDTLGGDSNINRPSAGELEGRGKIDGQWFVGRCGRDRLRSWLSFLSEGETERAHQDHDGPPKLSCSLHRAAQLVGRICASNRLYRLNQFS